MKKVLASLLIVGMFFIGCTGTFQLTNIVNDYHRQQEKKWMDEALFLAFVILPVYSIAMIGDAVILNAIEFWGGENPMARGDSETEMAGGEMKSVVAYDPVCDKVTIRSIDTDEKLVMERDQSGRVIMCDGTGKILYSAPQDLAGLSITAENRQMVR